MIVPGPIRSISGVEDPTVLQTGDGLRVYYPGVMPIATGLKLLAAARILTP